MDLLFRPAHELSKLMHDKELSAEELASAYLKQTDQVNGDINAFLRVTRDEALAQARAVDEARARGDQLAPLAGIPIALKDNLSTIGVETTCASKILSGYTPVFDATVVDRLRRAGSVFIGKTNMDEFAFGSSTENSAFGVTRNPWNTDCVPGGSSGGSAASVAASQAVFSLGSDTGGSIRQPASLCGVVGMKPTYGRVSRFGLVAFASSLDQIGPFTRDVRDCALLLNAICGHDPMDSTSVPADVPDFTSALSEDLTGMRIGIVKELTAEGISPDVREAFERAIKTFEGLGARCEEVSLPNISYSLPAYYLIAPSEASSNLARFDAVRYGHRTEKYEDMLEMYLKSRGEGFGAEAKRRIMLGTYALSAGYYDAYYGKALKTRTLIVRDFSAAFEKYDVLISPTTPTTAFKIGEKSSDPLAMYLSDVCTVPVNLAGIPAISVPCGLGAGDLPIGLQVMGKALDEENVLRAAYAFEQSAGSIGAPGTLLSAVKGA